MVDINRQEIINSIALKRPYMKRYLIERAVAEIIDGMREGVVSGSRVYIGGLGKFELAFRPPVIREVAEFPLEGASSARSTVNFPARFIPIFRSEQSFSESIEAINV